MININIFTLLSKWGKYGLLCPFACFTKNQKTMKILFILFAFCCFFPKSWSQQLILDSLNQLLQTETDPYERIDLHLGLARMYNFSRDTIQREKNIDLALKLTQEHSWDEFRILANLYKGKLEYDQGNGTEIWLEFIQKAIKLATESNSEFGLGMANYHLGLYYLIERKTPEEGIEFLTNFIETHRDKLPNNLLGNIHKSIGDSHEYLGNTNLVMSNWNQALDYYEKVKTDPNILHKLGHPSTTEVDKGLLGVGKINTNLTYFYSYFGEHEKAIAGANKAVSTFKKLDILNEQGLAYEARGYVYKNQNDYANAVENFQKANLIFEKNNNIQRLIGVQLILGRMFFDTKSYEPALEIFEKAKINSEVIRDTTYLTYAMGWLGKIYLTNEKTDKAVKVLEHALAIDEATESKNSRYSLLDKLSDAYVLKKNFSKAILLQKETSLINKSRGAKSHYQGNIIQIAELFTKLDQLDSAFVYLELASEYDKKNEVAQQRIALARVSSSFYEKKGAFEESLNHHKNFMALFKKTYTDKAQKVLKNEQVRQDVAGIEAEKKQAETLANLLASRNQLYLILALGLGFALLMGSYLFRQLRKTKDQLESQNLQLEQLNATRDKFFGIIAHDIRSPIVALDGVGEQMEYYLKKEDTKKLERLAGRVDVTAKRLNGLLDNLLSWALLQQGVIPFHPKSINVKNIGEQTFEMFEQNAKAKNISLKLMVDPQQKVFADEAALNTILRNLISNAIKFTPSGGTVSLGTETKEDKIFIKINDTGTGISAEKLTKLFVLEKQSETGTFGEKGTGLGLTLVKELVELNNGSIDVASVLEQGSSFLVGLPINP